MATKTTAQRQPQNHFDIDSLHEKIDLHNEDNEYGLLTRDIWRDKYRDNRSTESHPKDSMIRMVNGVYAKDDNAEAKGLALEAVLKFLWIPGGRILATAGTDKVTTMLNCYVSRTIEDGMHQIADANKEAMLTMQQGGGIGMNFSTLRPEGAYLQRTGATASGPLPFMDMWNSMCTTIRSAGGRRGAMMATLHCEHPDLPAFIEAKREKGRLTNFNVSVLVTDAFIDAVKNDEDWHLGFDIPREDGNHLFTLEQDNGGTWYAYSKWKARDLWDMIIKNTYEWSEPGILFIDRINDTNNLKYCEDIQCVNPCGEQPLPPYGCCNLGAVNLARMVKNPFTEDAEFDFTLLSEIATVGVRFLDNVIDVTHYPLHEQRGEEFQKRRIGVGFTGLADALLQLGVRYGSREAQKATESIMSILRDAVYLASSNLAWERGAFPLYSTQWGVDNPVVQNLPSKIQDCIQDLGIRNGVLLTVAPTGTTSMYAGNISSGLEPVFLNKMNRRVMQPDGEYRHYETYDYAYLLYAQHLGVAPKLLAEYGLPEYWCTHEDLSVKEHLEIQALIQRYIDASISKTINCPEDISFEAFKNVYMDAYNSGCKGVTTYKPSEVRGSVISGDALSTCEEGSRPPLIDRPEVLAGHTYKMKWPSDEEAYYITINEANSAPYEVFISSTSSKYTDWTTALSLMLSALMKRGEDISFVPEVLRKVVSVSDAGWIDGRFYGSLVALIGDTIGKHLDNTTVARKTASAPNSVESASGVTIERGTTCPSCSMPTIFHQDGCSVCRNCGYSTCS